MKSATSYSDKLLVLLARASSRVFALPLPHVVETMRPLATEPLSGMPPFVEGLTIIRGAPVPVVDLSSLLSGHNAENVARFVTLRVDDRRVALAVEQVIGVRELDAASLEQMPPLLQEAQPDLASAIGALDYQLLMVLQTSRIIPEDLWQALETREATP